MEKDKVVKLVSKIIVKVILLLMYIGGMVWLFFINWRIGLCVLLISWGGAFWRDNS